MNKIIYDKILLFLSCLSSSLSVLHFHPLQHSLNQSSIKCATPIHFAWGLPEKHPGRCYSKIPPTAQGQNNKTLLHNSATTTVGSSRRRKEGEKDLRRAGKGSSVERKDVAPNLLLLLLWPLPTSRLSNFQTLPFCYKLKMMTSSWLCSQNHRRHLLPSQQNSPNRSAPWFNSGRGGSTIPRRYTTTFMIHTRCIPHPHLRGIAASAWTKRLHTCRRGRKKEKKRLKCVCVWISDFMQCGGFTHTRTHFNNMPAPPLANDRCNKTFVKDGAIHHAGAQRTRRA